MLILSRRVGETIQIGPDIRVVITRIENNRVLVGIDAPREIAVWRVDADGHDERRGVPQT
jgi:carbon storage regulator